MGEFIQGFERSWCQEKDVSQAFGLGLESHHLLAKIMGCPLCWSKIKDNAFIVLSFHSGLSHGWADLLRKVLCLRRISVHPSKGVRLGLPLWPWCPNRSLCLSRLLEERKSLPAQVVGRVIELEPLRTQLVEHVKHLPPWQAHGEC